MRFSCVIQSLHEKSCDARNLGRAAAGGRFAAEHGVYQLPTGSYETRAVFAVRGGSFRDKRQFAATAILVHHPRGDLLIDAGFVTVPSGRRYAFIGDLTWQLDGIRRRAERPWLMRKLADSDPGQVRQGLLRVIALAGLMQVVPAHDVDAYEGIPGLPARLAPAAPPGSAGQSQ